MIDGHLLPYIDDSVILNGDTVVEDLLPDNISIVCRKTADNVEELVDVDRLQLAIVPGYVLCLHVAGDLGITHPATKCQTTVFITGH